MNNFYDRKDDLLIDLKKTNIDIADNNTLLLSYLDNSWIHKFKYIKASKKLFTDINKLSNHTNKYYVNEMIESNKKRKPYLDIETKYINKTDFDANYTKLIKKIQLDIIDVFQQEYKIKLTIEDILLLDSSGLNDEKCYKFSIHVIISPKNTTYYYTGNKFTESSAYHLCTSLIKKDVTYETLIDPSVYKNGQMFRIIGSYKNKYDNNRCLCPIDQNTFKKINITDSEKLRYFITYITTKNTSQINTPVMEQCIKKYGVVAKNKPSTTNYNNKLLDLVKKYHPTAHIATSNGNYQGFNYTNRKEPCPISNKIHTGSNGFYCYETNLGIYMRCHSTACKKYEAIHIGYVDEIDQVMHDAIQINTQFLSKCDTMLDIVSKWNDMFKLLAVKSPMATGKTTLIKHILDTYKYKKILWITHRQTLTHSLYGDFKKYGFVSYISNKGNLYNNDRLFVSLDSIERVCIDEYYDPDGDGILHNIISIKHYDLVIIDECESVFAHISSPYLNKYNSDAFDIFTILTKMLHYANKIIFLDADIGIRTNIMMGTINNNILVHNNYKPNPRHFEFTNCKNTYYNKIIKDIYAKLKLCIISMSSAALEKISAILEGINVNFVLHTSKTDDTLKEKLQDVNNFWIQYDVVLFSPTIQSGVDFNIQYFDKVYGILTDGPNTCCQRSWIQMIGRIRHIKCNRISCLYENIKLLYSSTEPNKLILNNQQKPLVNLYGDIYTFDDMLNYVRQYQTLNGRKILQQYDLIEDNVNGVTRIRINTSTKLSTYDMINLHTETENLNKSRDQFMIILNTLIIKAGNTISYDLYGPKQIKKLNEITSKQSNINKMLNINDDDYNIKELRKKQKNNEMTADDKIAFSKYCFKKLFHIPNNISTEQMEYYLNNLLSKEHIFKNMEYLFGVKDHIESSNIKINRDVSRLKVVVNLLQFLLNKKEFVINDIHNVKLSYNIYHIHMNKLISRSYYFKNEAVLHNLFFNNVPKVYVPKDKQNSKNTRYINCIKKIFDSYGIIFKLNRHTQGGCRICDYSFKLDDILLERLLAKHVELNVAPKYKQ